MTIAISIKPLDSKLNVILPNVSAIRETKEREEEKKREEKEWEEMDREEVE